MRDCCTSAGSATDLSRRRIPVYAAPRLRDNRMTICLFSLIFHSLCSCFFLFLRALRLARTTPKFWPSAARTRATLHKSQNPPLILPLSRYKKRDGPSRANHPHHPANRPHHLILLRMKIAQRSAACVRASQHPPSVLAAPANAISHRCCWASVPGP